MLRFAAVGLKQGSVSIIDVLQTNVSSYICADTLPYWRQRSSTPWFFSPFLALCHFVLWGVVAQQTQDSHAQATSWRHQEVSDHTGHEGLSEHRQLTQLFLKAAAQQTQVSGERALRWWTTS